MRATTNDAWRAQTEHEPAVDDPEDFKGEWGMTAPSVRRAMTDRQARVLKAIKSLTNERGLPPTIRDIQQRCQFRSPNGAVCHLRVLADRGEIIWEPGTARGILLADAAEKQKLLARLADLDVEELRRIVELQGG